VSDAAALEAGLATLGLELDTQARERLLAFTALLLKWNRAFNLISRRDEPRVVARHLLDALVLVRWLTGHTCADLGWGAGLPGLPLAIARPDIDFTLIDRSERRTRFLRQAKIELGLDNVDVITADLASYRPAIGFDTVVTRAVDHPEAIWPRARPLLARGGRALLQCGGQHAGARFEGAGSARYEPSVVPGLEHSHFIWIVDVPAA
jgi:16S rRNA (guanine527-N7)-methyltransferase